MAEAVHRREVGRQLASMSGVELDSIAPQDARLWVARGQALQALAAGDMDAALRNMGLVSSRLMDREEAWEIASNAVAVCIAAGWTRDMLVSSTEGGRAPCGRGYHLFCSGAIAACYFPMVCITDMNGRGNHFHIAHDLLNERDSGPYAIRSPTVPQQLRCSGDRRWLRPRPPQAADLHASAPGNRSARAPAWPRQWRLDGSAVLALHALGRGESSAVADAGRYPAIEAVTGPTAAAAAGPTGPLRMTAQLFPREPRRMKQPAKDMLCEQLAAAADRTIEQAEEIQRLRDAANQATEQLRAALATN